MVGLASGVVVCLLSLWVALTASQVHEGVHDAVTSRLGGASCLLPKFGFFAPNPGGYDYHLLYRDRLDDGSVSEWTEASELRTVSSPVPWLWSPDQYEIKNVLNCGRQLSQRSVPPASNSSVPNSSASESGTSNSASEQASGEPQSDGPRRVRADRYTRMVTYLMVLDYVSHADHSPRAELTQFAFVSSSHRNDDYNLRFVSNFHELPDD